MRCVVCLCGVRIDAGDVDALAAAYASHIDAEHAELEISPRRRGDALDAIHRSGGWDGQRLRLEGDVEVVPLRPDLKDDYLCFFDGEAFADNPAWASCYCVSYTQNIPPADFDERTAAENRVARAAQIEHGDASGVVAFADGKVVGWCHAAPRAALPLLDQVAEFATDDPAFTGAIVCYVISPAYRGQGLARRLLDGACDLLRERGLRCVEAYPPVSSGTDAGSYHGRLSMYLDAGFERVRDAGRHVVVRKSL